MLAGAGAAGVSGLLPGRLGRKAQAQSALDVYPTIFILLRGGVDPAMHFDAKTGYVNRNVQEADIRETAGGIRWYEPVLSSMTNHIEDCSVIRNISCSSSHITGWSLLWYGVGSAEAAATATPWPAYMTDELLRQHQVPAANLTTYVVNQDFPVTDYIAYNNTAPSTGSAAQRVQKILDFGNGLDVLQGQPSPEYQGRVFQTVASMDSSLYSPTVQPRTLDSFTTANTQATDLLTQPIPPIWPPSAETMAAFNLDPGTINETISQGNQRFENHLANAYDMARLRLSHSIFVQATGVGWDTHEQHDTRQRNSSDFAFTRIERLISALKATESPVEAGKNMLDTTHVVITSEITRANSADNGEDLDGSGTPHWPWAQAVVLGGRFKRDTTFGAVDAGQLGVPADFTTGALNQGRNPTFADLHATVMQANGVDPVGWDDSVEPINYLLK